MKSYIEKNRQYNAQRKMMYDLYLRDIDRDERIKKIFEDALFSIQNEIDRNYMAYAKSEGISVKEAKRRASEMDIRRFQERAKKAVEDKDFSKETSYWLKIYNLKMRVSRYELMKANIDLELNNAYDYAYRYLYDTLYQELSNEFANQAGILANSASDTAENIDKIVNMDFLGKNFSERIRDRRDGYYKIHQREIFKSLSNIFIHRMGYDSEIGKLSRTFDVSKGNVLRLLKTEVARANSQARDKLYKENGFTHYKYVCEPGACPICKPLDGKVFKVSEREIGVNAAPMHPNCRCRDYGIVELTADDFKDYGGYNENFNKIRKEGELSNFIEINDDFIFSKRRKGDEVKNLPVEMYTFMNFEDDYNLVYDYSEHEKEIAQWLSDNVGGKIYMCPRVLLPENRKTPDYIWDNEKWDLKDINKHSKNTISTAVSSTKNQSNNVILNLVDSTYNDDDLYYEMNRIFSNSRLGYIDKILILEEFKLRKIYRRA